MADQPVHPTKVCAKCGSEKPRTAEFYHFINGYPRPRCRPCWREWEREYFHRNREAKRQAAKRRWAKADKTTERAKLDEWRAANRDKVRATDIRRLERIKADPALKAKQAERQRGWRQKNPQKMIDDRKRRKAKDPSATARYSRAYAERYPEKVKAKRKAYWEKNPAKAIAYAEMRRERVRAAEGEITEQVVIDLMNMSGMVCYYCNKALTKFHVDHFVPVSRGGTNLIDNLVIACGPCNWRKCNKMPWEWMPERFLSDCTPR